jgi:hypothetical protein
MATAPKIIAADLADKMFGFGSKIATGEMTQDEADNPQEWPLHHAIAEALGGTVRAFDQYQGPYVLLGAEIRGEGVYAPATPMPGVTRLWINTEDGIEGTVYNEENERSSTPFLLNAPGAEQEAVSAAEEVLGNAPPEEDLGVTNELDEPQASSDALPGEEHLNSPLDGKSSSLKTAGTLLVRDDHPSSNTKLQQIMGDPMDQPISAFAQFYPNVGSMQMPNPLSPIEGDGCFFMYLIPGAVFQSHDGQQWVIEDYNAAAYGVEIYNRWYPRMRAFVNLDDIRRSIHSWVEPIQAVVPPPPPGVKYIGQPVRIVDGKSHA